MTKEDRFYFIIGCIGIAVVAALLFVLIHFIVKFW